MSTLVLQAHPIDGSYSSALLEAACEGLDTDALALHRIGCDGPFDAHVFDGVSHLVAVYPTWWGSVPAMMLGPLQDTLGPWIDAERAAPSPLRSIAQVTAVTTHGSSHFVNRLQGEPGRQFWQRVVLPHCAPNAQFEWIALYKMDRIDNSARVDFLDHVRATVTR